MENEIMSGQDGTIASVNVTKNQQVNTGDLMVSMN
jgi:biotin carboxyl carrier protein